MNYIIHLTENCNLRCKYCYENNYYNKQNNEIDFENIKALIDNEAKSSNQKCVITFYGGEPLLKKDLIYKTVEYAQKINKNKFYFAMTTNGVLFDEEFSKYAKANKFISIAYSIDGTKECHDLNRVFENGNGSFDIVEQNAKNVIGKFKSVTAMMVITKNNISNLADNIEHLYNLGFRTFNTLFNYSDEWNDEDLEVLKNELRKVCDFYYRTMMNGVSINIPLLDEKIKTHVELDFNCNDSCIAESKDVNVGVDGKYYFCMQFVYNKDFIVGDCKNGIDNNLLKGIIGKIGIINDNCKECELKKRCKHSCPCKNYILTNDVNGLSPVVCEFERIIIKEADELAEKLYSSRCKTFTNKFYTIPTIRSMVKKKDAN